MASLAALSSVANFLKDYPPFSFITIEHLEQLSAYVKLVFYAKGEILFEENTEPEQHFFIVKKGQIALSQIIPDREATLLVDECGQGDILGVRAIFAAETYLSTATAMEDSLVFTFPTQKALEVLEAYPKVSMYFASIFAMGISQNQSSEQKDDRNTRRFLVAKGDWVQETASIDTIRVEPNKTIIKAVPTESIQEVAQKMKKHRIGSIIIANEENIPIGIVTDTDLRSKVVAEGIDVNLPVSEIMASPVLTIMSGLSVLEVMLMMSSHRVSHLCLTEDGTTDTALTGVVSHRDILLLQGNNPSVIAKQIRTSSNIDTIRRLRDQAEKLVSSYLYQELAVPLISNVITQINDALIEKAIELAQNRLHEDGKILPKTAFCWLSLGSEGRKEQFLRTDQDNAFVYRRPEGEKEAEEARAYFLELNKHVTDFLIKWGFVKCPADMMASNPKWCQPIEQWKAYFDTWIFTPDDKALMNSTIFFDFRPIYGDSSLADELKEHIFQTIDKSPKFLSFLAKNALQNLPPLSFFNNMIVEKNGEHKDLFDIKARAMMPLADAARVFMLEFKLISYGSTFERFEEVGKLDDNLKDICYSAAMAYEILIEHRAISGFKHQNSGRYIDPKELNKLEKQILKTAFETISKLQKTLEVRYQLSYLR